jgi:hypothetical protein
MGGVVILPGSDTAKELAKFEQFPTNYTTGQDGEAPVGNPYQFRAYPKMLYRAVTRPDGREICMEPQPVPHAGGAQAEAQYNFELMQWERHTAACSKVVRSESEEAAARSEGWRETPKAALSRQEELRQDIARAAAESAFADERMGELAKRERAAAEANSGDPVVVVPAPRRRGPGKKKVQDGPQQPV